MAYKDPEAQRAYARAYAASPEGREKRRSYAAKYRASPEGREKRRAYERAYNATPEVREKIRARHRRRRGLPTATRPCPERCEKPGCKTPLPYKRGLALDHCHETGAFRGWLCSNCNIGIGKLGDNIPGLKGAIAYLERTGSGQ